MKPQTKLNFRHLCMIIGTLPSSYIDSLSYYENVLWLCKYLETVVIPTVNGNAEAVEELQALFTELRNYVDNYLNPTNLQPMVNEKLDQMLQDGDIYMSLKTHYDENTKELEFVVEAEPSTDLLERLATLTTPEGSE